MTIEEVRDKKGLKKFIKLPFMIYRDDPNWVPPLNSDMVKMFSPKDNPFYDHAEVKLYIARDDGAVVGRIAAIVDDMHISTHNEQAGFFGFYESTNDQAVAKALYDTAGVWLKSKGMKIMRGPMNPSINDEVGFLVRGFDSPPVIMMTYTPPYYLDLAEKYGFKKAMNLYAYYQTTAAGMPEKVKRVVDIMKRRNRNVVLRTLDMSKMKEEIEKVKKIYNIAWAKNWGAVPMTDREFDALVARLKPLVVPEIVAFVEVDGKTVGVGVGIPDYNQVLLHLGGKLFPFGIFKFLRYKKRIDQCRLLILGILSEYQQMGLDALLYWQIFLGVQKLGYRGGEFSWTLENNYKVRRPAELWAGEPYKSYRIYEKKL
jgi:hypothetical protein